jgi:ABC-2 type transport system permease protein
MNAATETSESFVAPATAPRPVRPFYWSVMRELWENRSLMIAPLAAGGLAVLALLGLTLRAVNSPQLEQLASMPPEMPGKMAMIATSLIAYGISSVMHIAVFFYLLDSLQTERKDRSVLFWKSMPVSDTTTVLSKLFTALIVSGAIVVVVAIATQIVVLLLGSVIFMIGGVSPAPLWTDSQLLQTSVALVYWQLAIALWFAPVAAWLLLVSAWAKRVTILWALLTPLAVMVFERVAIGTRYVQDMINYRMDDPVLARFMAGQRGAGFSVDTKGFDSHGFKFPGRVLDSVDPIAFLANPWLWVGLVVAAGLVAAAIWMRRYREPI